VIVESRSHINLYDGTSMFAGVLFALIVSRAIPWWREVVRAPPTLVLVVGARFYSRHLACLP
jgi:hypothetical protein